MRCTWPAVLQPVSNLLPCRRRHSRHDAVVAPVDAYGCHQAESAGISGEGVLGRFRRAAKGTSARRNAAGALERLLFGKHPSHLFSPAPMIGQNASMVR